MNSTTDSAGALTTSPGVGAGGADGKSPLSTYCKLLKISRTLRMDLKNAKWNQQVSAGLQAYRGACWGELKPCSLILAWRWFGLNHAIPYHAIPYSTVLDPTLLQPTVL